MQLQVIYDADLEIATVIDSETFRSMGPVALGPNGKGELQQFVDRMPETVFTSLSSYELTRAWGEYWEANFSQLYKSVAETDSDQVEPTSHFAVDEERLAQIEAATASTTPAEQPHDTDVATVTSPSNTVTAQCYNCNGDGFIVHDSTGEKTQCGICNGTGKVTLPA